MKWISNLSIIYLAITFVISVISINELKAITKIKEVNNLKNESKLYWHPIKSFIDTYNLSLIACIFIMVICPLYIKFTMFYKNDMLMTKEEYFIWTVLFVLIDIIPGFVFSYSFSEIKHLSPQDDIGQKIQKSKDKDKQKKAMKYYKVTSITGILGLIATTLQLLSISVILTLVSLFLYTLVFILGMGDVLQHSNYNDVNYNESRKKMNILDKYYFTEIIQLFKTKKKFKIFYNRLRDNLLNIAIGCKYLLFY
jgi:hypothetical protein